MTTKDLDIWARPLIVQAFTSLFGRTPTLPEAQAAQGVARLETRYGTAWKMSGKGSNNWGAIQKSRPPCDPNTSFQYTDTSPQPDGTSKPYTVCFKKYATELEGATDLVRVVYSRRQSVLRAATEGNYYKVSAELYATRYYEGFGKTPADRIANHHRVLVSCIRSISESLGEPFFVYGATPEEWHDEILEDNPTILRGSRGEYVKTWQRILNEWLPQGSLDKIVVDGNFGDITREATIYWQRAHHLRVDSIVGPLTWSSVE